jgi:myo-inositol-1(or 4)-monophosphatase
VTPTPQEITDAQNLVAEVFKDLRSDLLSAFGKVEHTRKSDRSPVTEWDVKVETTLSAALKEAFPNVGFEGEETGHSGDASTYWLVDPIDGTSSFIRGLAYSTNMAALVHEGKVLAAVIYDFVNDVLYTAQKGKGAFKDGQPIKVKERQAGNLVAYSFTRNTFGLIREAMQEVGIRALLIMGAAGHTYAMLAEGKIDGIIALNVKMGAYDNAPGMLLAEEAGAIVLNYDEKTGVNRQEFIIGSTTFTDLVERSGLI